MQLKSDARNDANYRKKLKTMTQRHGQTRHYQCVVLHMMLTTNRVLILFSSGIHNKTFQL